VRSTLSGDDRARAFELTIAGLLFAVGAYWAAAPLGALAGSMAANFLSKLGLEGSRLWLSGGQINGHIARALRDAFRKAVRQLKTEWEKSGHVGLDRKDHAVAERTLLQFDDLKKKAERLLAGGSLASLLQDDEVTALAQGRTDPTKLIEEWIASYFFGHDEQFIEFLQKRLALTWAECFGEELKNPQTGTEAWRAYQLAVNRRAEQYFKDLAAQSQKNAEALAKNAKALAWIRQRIKILNDRAWNGDDESTRLLDVKLTDIRKRLDQIYEVVVETRDVSKQSLAVSTEGLAVSRQTLAAVQRLGPSGAAAHRTTRAPLTQEQLDAKCAEYLGRLREKCRHVDLRDDGATGDVKLELGDVYTKLRASDPTRAHEGLAGEEGRDGGPMEGTQTTARDNSVDLSTVFPRHPHIALVGDPGAGKSTFLRYVALYCAVGCTGTNAEKSDAKKRLGWPQEKELPFPLLARFEEFARYLQDDGESDKSTGGKASGDGIDARDASPRPLYRFLERELAGHAWTDDTSPLLHLARMRPVVFLLDGLDEIADDALRERVREIVDTATIALACLTREKPEDARFLATCRTAPYVGRTEFDPTFEKFTLLPWGEKERADFVRRWVEALAKTSQGRARWAGSTQKKYEDGLLNAIENLPVEQDVTGNPLIVHLLAYVYDPKTGLPTQRAALYDRVVEKLLVRRKEQSVAQHAWIIEGLRSVHARTPQNDSPYTSIVERLARLEKPPKAQQVQKAEREIVTHDFRRRAFGALALHAMCAEQGKPAAELEKGEARTALDLPERDADTFLRWEALYSSIVVERTRGTYAFWHGTFRDFLAADALRAMGGQQEWWDTLQPHLFESEWRIATLFLAGIIGQQDGRKAVVGFLERILTAHASDLAAHARAVGLVREILREVGLLDDRATLKALEYETHACAAAACFERGAPRVEERFRVEVGEALEQCGEDPLKRECVQRVEAPDHPGMVLIHGGRFLMGAQARDPNEPGYDPEAFPDEDPPHPVDVLPFYIDIFPVTVAQYATFVDAGTDGYLRRENWRSGGWEWRQREERLRPDWWDGQRVHPTRPVVGVRWYEADAYARWCGKRLPTEAEWEFAARGPGEQPRTYPWERRGEPPRAAPPTEQQANFDMRVGHPTPVGLYPAGATPEGVYDLAGNVWEWCEDAYAQYGSPRPPYGSAARVMRGGSFYYDARDLRAVCRLDVHPESDFVDVGFRCVVSVAGGQTSGS
jgi:formylglycine-generating enzyme required for sulfatase activity/predicted metal-dependent hydrolase